MHDYLIDDLGSVCELAIHDATETSRDTDVAKWGAACLQSTNRNLLAYHAHLARDANQGMFQPWCFTMVENDPSMVTELYGFWAK